MFLCLGYPLPVVLNDQSAAVLPVITTDKDIDVVRPLEVPEGIREEYVTANKKVHQDCKSAPPSLCLGFAGDELCESGGGADLFLSTDDPDLYHGLPVNVQVIGRRFQEEKVLAITEYIDGLLKGGEVEHGSAHKL